jgi:hypothetical protein
LTMLFEVENLNNCSACLVQLENTKCFFCAF